MCAPECARSRHTLAAQTKASPMLVRALAPLDTSTPKHAGTRGRLPPLVHSPCTPNLAVIAERYVTQGDQLLDRTMARASRFAAGAAPAASSPDTVTPHSIR